MGCEARCWVLLSMKRGGNLDRHGNTLRRRSKLQAGDARWNRLDCLDRAPSEQISLTIGGARKDLDGKMRGLTEILDDLSKWGLNNSSSRIIEVDSTSK